MKRIFQFSHCTLHLYRKKIILFSVLSIGSSLISLFNTLLSGRFIDFLASPNCVEWKPQLCYYCILFLATIMISFAISFALGRIREKLHTMVSYNIDISPYLILLSVFGVICQPLSLIELEKGHFARYFKKFFSFFKNTLRNTLCPILKIEEPEKCVRQRLHRK